MSGGSAIGAILLAVLGGVVYHASAKSIPKDLSPTLVLVAAYASALIVSALAYFAMPGLSSGNGSGRLVHPAVIGLGLGAAMIELGYVLTYRAAWSVSVASVIVNGMVAALLVPLGVMLFGEHLTTARVAGLLLCLAGVWLLRH
jgi:multidrug transporter EmrE-like cation transporter